MAEKLIFQSLDEPVGTEMLKEKSYAKHKKKATSKSYAEKSKKIAPHYDPDTYPELKGLSVYARGCLVQAGHQKQEEIWVTYTLPQGLKAVPGLGAKSIAEVENWLLETGPVLCPQVRQLRLDRLVRKIEQLGYRVSLFKDEDM